MARLHSKQTTLLLATVVAVLMAMSHSPAQARMLMAEKRDGSTITVSTTQFNPAITNQGGTTNAAGTFNVSPLATSSSYQFQTVVQTSTFQLSGAAATQTPASGSNSGSGSGSGSSGSGSGSDGGSGSGDSVVIVTATAPTMTVGGAGASETAVPGTTVDANSNQSALPTLALGAQNAALASMSTPASFLFSLAALLSTSLLAAVFVL
ncbi:hypothetical protein BCV70DRAFT_69165 [Testicularia cyperi]|uniref:Uncharacterized protein n=1 Tax=Testicularia cyperi TaxID=1882483 RepID=A0A317XFC4_9BASI|nr:hypothetical protein BCV70DRAFT_81997 [Testicularia cyperi]PWY97298.1 hypothetical protein BCV70DRAFT_69165 [Testicularia cyperi]